MTSIYALMIVAVYWPTDLPNGLTQDLDRVKTLEATWGYERQTYFMSKEACEKQIPNEAVEYWGRTGFQLKEDWNDSLIATKAEFSPNQAKITQLKCIKLEGAR